jgi:ATP-binding cassette subfamily B protein
VARNSSDIISGITDKTETVIFGVITPALVLVSSSIILGSIIAILFWADPAVAFAVFGGFGAIYLLIILLTRRRLIINSQITADESTQVLKTLQEGLGGIRDVLLDGSQEAYCAIFKNADLRMHRAQGSTIIIGQSPRHGIELLGMLLIAGLAYSLSLQPDGIRGAIPVLGALALGAQRLLPLLQQAYNSWSRIQGSQVELQETLELLDQPMPDKHEQPHAAQSIQFIESIQLKKLGFRYNESSPWILKNIDLRITKGCRIGIIGMTASGKSTLIDIIMCLLAPTEGTLEIDGQVIDARNYRGWQAHIAHVPQSIYLADTSIAENIAFGVPVDRIDRRRVEAAACEAQIAEFVDTLPAKYDTYVGERGIRLSGGQRQRIGIARALYKQADVIIFDEATSALDTETENAVMQAIENLSADLTIIIIAHRVTTLKNCTQIVELSEGGISRIGTFTEIIK